MVGVFPFKYLLYIHIGKETMTANYREAYLEYLKHYREENKEKIKEGKARYRAKPENKEKEKTYAKQYRETHKNYSNEKIVCENCGATISRNSLSGHRQSKKCLNHNKPKMIQYNQLYENQ